MSGQDDKIRWLGNQLSRWISENIIDENTAERIRQLYPQIQSSRSWAMIVFSGIGACVIGLGVILLFAYNWAAMSKFTKLTIIFGSIALSHFAGITIFFRSKRFKALGEALTIIGTMLFGSGIFLVAQIYHINEHFPNAFLLWGIGAALLAWTMPSIAQAVMAAILFTLWAIMEGVAFGISIPYIFGLLLLLFPLAYIKRNGLLVGVLLLALGFSTLFVVSADNDEIVFYVLLSLFTLYTAIGIIQQKFDKFESMDLKKYLTINKGNRSKTFVDTPQYYAFAEGQESTLRNSSHHGAMKIDQKGRVITYRSGGTGGTRKIAYAKYLYYCNEIFLQTAALLMLEVAFSYER